MEQFRAPMKQGNYKSRNLNEHPDARSIVSADFAGLFRPKACLHQSTSRIDLIRKPLREGLIPNVIVAGFEVTNFIGRGAGGCDHSEGSVDHAAEHLNGR